MTVVDTKHILDVATVVLLVLTCWQSRKLQECLDRCIELLQSMDSVGLCKYVSGDLLTIIESYNDQYRRGNRTNEVPLEHGTSSHGTPRWGLPCSRLLVHVYMFGNQICSQPQFSDLELECYWNQESTTAAFDWSLLSWNVSSVTEDQLQSL